MPTNGYYQSIADDDADQDQARYRAISPDGTIDRYRVEPKRSRIQTDISKAARVKINNVAKERGMNTKQLIVYALIQTFPDLEDALQYEVRYPGYAQREEITTE